MPAAPRLLIIDDEPQLRNMLRRVFEGEGYHVATAETGAAGLKLMKDGSFPVVLCDVRLPDAHGVELTRALKALQPASQVVVMTAFGSIPDAVQAMRNGAFQYLVKGDDNAKLIPTVSAALQQVDMDIPTGKGAASDPFAGIIGRSAAIKHAIGLARKVAPTGATVLLTGATGTGKEVFAQAVHAASTRSKLPLLAVNCGALSKELLESELFGHVAGAFTGALKDKKGLIEAARGGTLFLDEVGEMPLELQAKLLRVLETGDYLRVGDTVPRKADVRFLAATHRNIAPPEGSTRFREDLYYRLAAFVIRIPDLAERPGDILLLAEHFLSLAATRYSKTIQGIGEQAAALLNAYNWPGQVRELRNVIERACILCDGPVLDPAALPLELQGAAGQPANSSPYDLEQVEREHIRRVLAHTAGNKTLAATLLGIGLTTLYAKLKKWGM
ncbi:MAG: sigma-54-dependent Fis family transcriptional regulator [Flavobacteriales bacterium]|nr:sigma-54-dependent Fis family transcriptional regulator [Flavobacteriales bacterium]